MIRMTNKKDDGIEQRILTEAVKLFSEKGFHGTSMRELASAASCSLPMLYYYYNNKEDLFYKLAYSEFVLLIEKLNSQVKRGVPLSEIYFEAVKQRKELSAYDKAVYKLAMKVWLGFDGDSKAKNDLLVWENGRLERTKRIFSALCDNEKNLETFSNIIVRIMENMIEKIILFDDEISDDEIKNEIQFLIINQKINGGI
jgi:AcrR family transcriptional regulator